MRTTGEKGLMFSLDLLIAFIIICSMLYFMLFNIDLRVKYTAQILEKFSFYHNAFSLADAAIKTSDSNNSAFGFAFYDSDKHRVLDNVLDYTILKSIAGERISNEIFSLEAVAIDYATGEREIISSTLNERKNDCSAIERIALVKNNQSLKKAKISLLFCRAQK